MSARPSTGATGRMPGPASYVHTADNAVPLLAEHHEDILDGLHGLHAGIDLIRAGFRLIMTERLTLDETQTLMSALAGDADGNDVQGLIAAAVARLSDADTNPCLRQLDHDTTLNVRRIGAAVAVDLDTTAPRDLVAELSARTDPYGEHDDAAGGVTSPGDQGAEEDEDSLEAMNAAYERMDQEEYAQFMDSMDARDAAAAGRAAQGDARDGGAL